MFEAPLPADRRFGPNVPPTPPNHRRQSVAYRNVQRITGDLHPIQALATFGGFLSVLFYVAGNIFVRWWYREYRLTPADVSLSQVDVAITAAFFALMVSATYIVAGRIGFAVGGRLSNAISAERRRRLASVLYVLAPTFFILAVIGWLVRFYYIAAEWETSYGTTALLDTLSTAAAAGLIRGFEVAAISHGRYARGAQAAVPLVAQARHRVIQLPWAVARLARIAAIAALLVMVGATILIAQLEFEQAINDGKLAESPLALLVPRPYYATVQRMDGEVSADDCAVILSGSSSVVVGYDSASGQIVRWPADGVIVTTRSSPCSETMEIEPVYYIGTAFNVWQRMSESGFDCGNFTLLEPSHPEDVLSHGRCEWAGISLDIYASFNRGADARRLVESSMSRELQTRCEALNVNVASDVPQPAKGFWIIDGDNWYVTSWGAAGFLGAEGFPEIGLPVAIDVNMAIGEWTEMKFIPCPE